MKHVALSRIFCLLLPAALVLSACQRRDSAETADEENEAVAKRKASAANKGPVENKGPALTNLTLVNDKSAEDVDAYRLRVRQLYNNSRFDELEALADEARAKKARFDNGSWLIYQFYDCMDPSDSEPESMWQRHDRIHQAWIAAKPESITARVAYVGFLTTYAWQARGGGYADTVTNKGWELFGGRLKEAQKVLFAAKDLPAKCPMWWRYQMKVALGQGWDRAQYDKLFAEAKAFDPEFWAYDVARANYLLPRWHGEEGDWEMAAENEINQPGLGVEVYARVVIQQRGYYDNIFKDTKASWPKAREGLDVLRRNYPQAEVFLSQYARLACLAEDAPLARKVFEEIGSRPHADAWKSKDDFLRFRNWAYGEP